MAQRPTVGSFRELVHLKAQGLSEEEQIQAPKKAVWKGSLTAAKASVRGQRQHVRTAQEQSQGDK